MALSKSPERINVFAVSCNVFTSCADEMVAVTIVSKRVKNIFIGLLISAMIVDMTMKGTLMLQNNENFKEVGALGKVELGNWEICFKAFLSLNQ